MVYGYKINEPQASKRLLILAVFILAEGGLLPHPFIFIKTDLIA